MCQHQDVKGAAAAESIREPHMDPINILAGYERQQSFTNTYKQNQI